MRIYDLILGLFILNLLTNFFNATIFSDSNIQTQGLDTSQINASITDYQQMTGETKETGFLESLWSGAILTSQSVKFVLKLFLSAEGFGNLFESFGMHPLIVTIFEGVWSILLAFTIFLLIWNRRTDGIP